VWQGATLKLPVSHKTVEIELKISISVFSSIFHKDTFDGLILNSNVGAVEVSLAFFSKQGTLKVGVKRCINLQPVKGNHTANPLIQV